MPVEPIPCAPEGGGGTPVEVTTCCSPSIASTPLCRPDGTTLLLVVRSGCAECGQDAGDPAVAGWIDPATGTYTPGSAPADAGPCDTGGCCSPSITSTTLCRPDGTTLLLVVRSGCAECGQDAGDPVLVGWFDLATGVLTPGPAPTDAAPCDAGCLDTVCRTRCDDTDGDGAADATYTELWCIKPDGTAELVLTYQDDPSSPYTPTAPMDCEYGCPETETLTLCDDGGPFLRRVTWLQGTATYEDVALDGVTPHVVTGTVTTCAATAEECAERTTPAATLGLCLPDGTPLAVLITRDCDGTTTQDGWLNLTTGTYTSGPPPVGAAACGDSRAFELAGLLCDTDPATGDVYGLVLVEYAYNPDGSLASVRLVDPATGATYTLQGELRRCPADAGAELPEQDLTVLCDVQADGTSVPFVRDYRRNPATGQITGLTDYTLDGQPYTVTGTVGTCTPEAEPCRNTGTVLLCDQPAGAFTADVPLATLPQGPASGTLPNGVQYSVDRGQWFNADQGYGIYAEATQTWTFDQPVTVEFAVGGLSAVGECVLLPAGVTLVSLGPDHTYDPATRRLCPIAGGNTSHSVFRTAGEVQSLTWQAVGLTNMGRGLTRVSVSAALEPVQFLRQVVTDCATGAVVSVTDTTLDGQPYTVVGEVGQCQAAGGGECCPPEPCRSSSTLLVCDLPAGGTPTATVTDTDPTPYYPYPTAAPVAGAQALWDGGTLTLPPGTAPQPGTTGSVNSLAATIQAPRPGCDTGTAHVTVTLNVQQTGPDNGCGQVGHLRIFTGTTQTALTVLPAGAPAGYFGTLTVEADVPAADLAAGNVAFAVALDAYDDTPSCTPSPRRTGWTLSAYTTAVTYDQDGCETQFLRTVTVDCETGAVTGVEDTTLDGQPYTVTGEVGECTPAGGGQQPAEPCRNTSTLLVCDLPGDGEPTPVLADAVATPYQGAGLGAEPVTGGAAALWTGGTLTIPADTSRGPDHADQHLRSFAAEVQAPRPGCDTGTATVTASVRVERTGPDAALGGNGLWDLWVGGVRLALARTASNAPVGYTDTLTVSAQVPAADLAAGNVLVTGALETWQTTAHVGGWIVDQAAVTVVYDQTGCGSQFLRNVTTDCETGAVTAVVDTTLDGQPYTPTGEVGQCTPAGGGGGTPPQPCRDTSTALLCDTTELSQTTLLDTVGVTGSDGWEVVSVTYDPACSSLLPPAGTPPFPAVWANGRLGIRPDMDIGGTTCYPSFPGYDTAPNRWIIRKTFTAPQDGIATITATGFGGDGSACLRINGAYVGQCGRATNWTAQAPVTAGTNVAEIEVADVAGPNYAQGRLDVAVSSTVQFFRTLVTDCETGDVLTVTDTTLDGAPYTVTGEVGQCQTAGGECCPQPEPEPCRDTSTVLLCDAAATESVTVLDPTSVLGPDGWQVVSFTGSQPGYGPAAAMPYDAFHRINGSGVGQLSVRPDFNVGPPTVPWPGYDAAPIAWTIRKTFNLAVGGLATVTVDGFKGDHGARVRMNGVDLGLYAQYNQPVDGGVFQVPVNAGANVIEVEDHDINHVSYIQGRITVTVSGETQFLRTLIKDCATGHVLTVTDTTLDGEPYTVTGQVSQCTPPVDDGEVSGPEPCMSQTVITACRCDDTDGDGQADAEYVELIGVDCSGSLTPLGTYTPDLAQPYTPVSPVPCEDDTEGAEPALGVQAGRVELAPGASWDAATVLALQSVTATAHTGTGEITTAEGTSTLFQGESATWSTQKEGDALLAGPLTITAVTGIVTVTFTRGVTL